MTQTFTSRDGMKIAYYVDDFTDPWTKPDTLLLLHAALLRLCFVCVPLKRWWRCRPWKTTHRLKLWLRRYAGH